MRILGFWFKSLIVLVVVATVGGLLTREALLIWGVAKLRTSVGTLRNVSRNTNQYARQCLQKGATIDGNVVDKIQLRFISETNYVLEVVCSGFQLDPISIKNEQLPFLVKKQAGSGGIIWGDSISGVVLSVLGRSRAVLVEQQEIFYEGANANLGVSPRTSCEGFGYTCCSPEASVGVGQVQPAVTDCPRSCYSSCQQIPVVLSFNSDPFLDPKTRTATVKSGQTVSFSYVTDGIDDEENQVILNYGDGTIDTLTELSGVATHVYSCSGGACSFSATLQVQTASGLLSANLPASRITIKVN